MADLGEQRSKFSGAIAETADVLIVGAGPVGLSLAIELGLRGRDVVLVERELARGPQPRAKTLNMRSLEHFRRWGVADAVRAASPLPADLPCDVVFQTRLFGKHIATLPNIYFRGSSHADDPRFSEPSEWIPQHLVEDVLRAKVASLPNVVVHQGCELIDFEEDGDSVVILLKAAERADFRVRAAYLVGADGARSTVRERLGVSMRGRYAYAANFNMVLRIPELDRRPPQPRGLMHWTINADSPAVMGPIGGLWYVAKQLGAGVSGLSDDEIRDCVTAAVGRPVDYEVVTVDPWYAHELIADSYRAGRVFLAGDACHLHPPFGGYGMNMGICDAVDLGWKLDAVLAGWGGDALLDSYEFERRRVHEWTIQEAVENYRVLSSELLRPGLEEDGPAGEAVRREVADEVVAQKRREFHTIGLVLGYHYGGSPAIAGDDLLPPPSAQSYIPEVKCGALAPHLWLAPGVSLYDRFGPGFTLIDTNDGRGGGQLLAAAAKLCRAPLTVLTLDDPHVIAHYGRGLTLVRPDEHIAWHGEAIDEDEAARVMRIVSGRS